MHLADPTTSLLVSTAVATALFHAAIPDHWLPFVLIGRARRWSARTTAFISGLSGLVHTLLSVMLALVALWIGRESARLLGQGLEHVGAPLLIVFGLTYAFWAWRKGGHFHPGGKLFHGRERTASCEGLEGDRHPEHLHYHADEALIHDKAIRGGLSLALIVGLNPCVLILPIVFQTAERGRAAVVSVVLSYTATTVASMVGLSVAGVAGAQRIRLPGAARHMETASGLLVAAVGALFLLLDR